MVANRKHALTVFWLLLWLCLHILHFAAADNKCSPQYLSAAIHIPNNGAVKSLSANPVANYSGGSATPSIDFCNATVTYTHPGWNDTILITVWMPPQSKWNGRFQGTGGSAWAGDYGYEPLAEGVADNYATGETDTGHSPNLTTSTSWYLTPEGKLNIPLLKDYAYIAYNDLAVVGKQLSSKFYGYGPVYSYWNGCSTGGRQGLQLAQKYPTAFNGIYAGSPAINFPNALMAIYWPQFVMNSLNHYPPSCILDYFTDAVTETCDDLDGVKDGVIAALSLCHFNPYTLVNQTVNCSSTSITITTQDAEIVQKSWQGARTPNGSFLWYGLNPGASLDLDAATTCSGSVSNCTGTPFVMGPDWIRHWVLADPDFNLTNMTWSQYSAIFAKSAADYNGIIGSNNPDLSAFKQVGGKIVHWHGGADYLIPTNGSVDYYSRVLAVNPDVDAFYRFFLAPGVGHCGGGNGQVPTDPFGAVVSWVENGTVPDTLPASNANSTRDLCPYPLVSVYNGGDASLASSFSCEKHWR